MEGGQRSSTLNVCLRVKPTHIPNESNNAYVINSEKSLRVKTWKGNEIYTFSHIFNENSSQEDVFKETADPAVKLFLEGQDCLLFAYGTTNAGKTFSVQGTHSNPGIVPQTIVKIFSSIKNKIDKCPRIAPVNYSSAQLRAHKEKIKVEKMKNLILSQQTSQVGSARPSNVSLINCSLSFSSAFSSTISNDSDSDQTLMDNATDLEELGWNQACRCSLWVSMVEVYNENVIDLLGPIKTNAKVGIATDPDGRFYLQGQTEINVSSLEEAKTVIQYGNKQRKNSSTLLNISSSRSHCILRLRLLRADRVMANMMQVGPQSPAAVDIDDFHVSTFMFCDLAGAERVNKAGNKGERAKESCNINNSLVVLGRCLETLRLKGGTMQYARNAIVPYRDSKLTMILQPLLCEPGPKSLLVNINTSKELLDETLNVLKFSSVARVIVVKEQVNPTPHYQMPTHAKQLLELRAAMELEDSLAREARISEEPEHQETELSTAEMEIQTSFVEMSAKISTEEQTTQTEIFSSVSDTEEVAALKTKILLYQQKEEKISSELQSKISAVRAELFASFEAMESQMLEAHKEQLESKESQLYNLMTDRLNIQETFYKDLLDRAEADAKCLQDKLKVTENIIQGKSDEAIQGNDMSIKEMEELKDNLQQQKQELLVQSEEHINENKDLLYAYGEKDKELEEALLELANVKKALKDKDLQLESMAVEMEEIRKDQIESLSKYNHVQLELDVRNDMLNTALVAKQDMIKQHTLLVTDCCDKDVKIQELESENACLKKVQVFNDNTMQKFHGEIKQANADLQRQCDALKEDNTDLEKDIQAIKEQLKNTLAENIECKDKADKKFKNEQCLWSKKLETAKEDTQRYKQMAEYLMDQYRPDYRRSVAGCAYEEAAWQELEKEIQAIPSQYAELQKKNYQLKLQLDIKEQDLQKFIERRDTMLNQYERDLQLKNQELENCKRETQALNKELLGMTPRKQNSTPHKSEFKTPLRASVNLKLPDSASSANKSASKRLLDASEDADFETLTRRSTRKVAKLRLSTPAAEEDVEINKQSSCRRRAARPKLSPAKENMEPPAPPSECEKPVKSKSRSRRKLCANSLHPALDQDDSTVDVEISTPTSLQETKRRLRSAYKF